MNAAFMVLPLIIWLLRKPRSPRRAGLGFAASFLIVNTLTLGHSADVIYAKRSYFGTHRVLELEQLKMHVLMHGTTIHGTQSTVPEKSTEPTLYFYREGTAGQAMRAVNVSDQLRVAVVGLGAGALACYARPQQVWDYYELDENVVEIARDPSYFTYIRDCAPQTRFIVGDARQQLAAADDNSYDVLVLDAYGSDSIPLHLLTREAFTMYLGKLSPNGVIIFHISSKYYNLGPIISRLSSDAGLVARMRIGEPDPSANVMVHAPSTWVVAARSESGLGQLRENPQWKVIDTPPATPLWTDDFSSALSTLQWKQL